MCRAIDLLPKVSSKCVSSNRNSSSSPPLNATTNCQTWKISANFNSLFIPLPFFSFSLSLSSFLSLLLSDTFLCIAILVDTTVYVSCLSPTSYLTIFYIFLKVSFPICSLSFLNLSLSVYIRVYFVHSLSFSVTLLSLSMFLVKSVFLCCIALSFDVSSILCLHFCLCLLPLSLT